MKDNAQQVIIFVKGLVNRSNFWKVVQLNHLLLSIFLFLASFHMYVTVLQCIFITVSYTYLNSSLVSIKESNAGENRQNIVSPSIHTPTDYGPYTRNMDLRPIDSVTASTTSHPTLAIEGSTAPFLPSLFKPTLKARLVAVRVAAEAFELEDLAFGPNYSTQTPRHKKVALLTRAIIASTSSCLLKSVFTYPTTTNPA